MQAPTAHAKGLDIVCHIATGLPCCVIGDSLRLSQVLTNLISNAIKFTLAGSVTVQAGIEGDTVLRVVVVDTGIGIASEAVPQLFRPFVQGDESVTRRFGGSEDLGLSISASLVRALGGQIDLQSNPGEGTRVTVRLPLALPGCGTAVSAPLPRLRVALACSPGNPPTSRALRDYLGACFELREFVDARTLCAVVAGADAWVPDLWLSFGESEIEACEEVLPASVLLVQLQRVEADVDAARSSHCHSVVSLPLRRRELLAACLQSSGNVGRVAASCCSESADDGERALASHCLVVEDNALNLRMIATQLRTLGVRVSEARSGAEALELLSDDTRT